MPRQDAPGAYLPRKRFLASEPGTARVSELNMLPICRGHNSAKTQPQCDINTPLDFRGIAAKRRVADWPSLNRARAVPVGGVGTRSAPLGIVT